MKKVVLVLILSLFSSFSLFAQAKKTLAKNKEQNTLTPKDSLILDYLETYRMQLREPVYKLYPTNNNWTFLKLNTATGQIWQVQYSIDDSPRMEYVLDDNERISDLDDAICGRFELHQTKNSFNFILLDNIDGRCWQVQWSIEKDKRMVLRIY